MRRILAILLVLTVLTLPVLPAAADAEKADFSFLKAVGILDAGFNPDTFYVTRAEAAMLLVRSLGNITVTDERVFSDVGSGDSYAAEIATAYKMGIISGYGDGTFHPNQSVTVNQMIKMLLSLLGYKQYAEAQGGYPAGYQILANQKELTMGLTANGDAPLDYVNMTKVMRAALDATVAEGTKYEDGYVGFADSGVPLLAAWHGIDKVRGLVSADSMITLSADRAVRQDEVAIEGKVYKVGETNATMLFAQQAEAYIDRETETILYIAPRVKDAVIKIATSEILDATESTLTYETSEGKKEKISIAGAAVIKNGSLLASWTAQDLRFDNGRLQLISSPGGDIAYILAEQYVTRIVDYVSIQDKTVYFKDGGSVVVDPEKGTKRTLFLEASGYPADLAYCFPWDVFSVMEGTNTLKIIRSEKFIRGTVDEISTDSITIDGILYKLAPGFPSKEVPTVPTVGMNADFYFDYTNALVAVDTSHSKSGSYGVLVGMNSKKGLTAETQMKIYTDKAEMQGFEVAEKVCLNGNVIPEAELTGAGSPVYSGTAVIRQLVTYKLNGKGEIAEINTAQDYTMNPDSEGRLSCFSRDVYINENRYTAQQANRPLSYLYETSESFGRKYLARPATKIFELPPEGAPDDAYKMSIYTSLPGGSDAGALTNVTLFDVDANYHIGAIVWEKNDTVTVPTNLNSRMFVTKTYSGLDAEGFPSYFIEGFNEFGKEIKLSVEEGMTAFFGKALTDPKLDNPDNFEKNPRDPVTWPTQYKTASIYMNGKNKHIVPATEIQPGDMINYLALGNGQATLLNIVARCRTAPEIEINYDSYFYDLKNTYEVVFGEGYCYVISAGRVKSRIPESFVMDTHGRVSGNTFIRAYPDAGLTLLFDTKTGTTRKISLSEMEVGDKVVVWNRISYVLFKVVIR